MLLILITKVLIRGRKEDQSQRRDGKKEEEAAMGFLALKMDEGATCQENRHLQKWGKERRWILPQGLQTE